MDAAAAEAEGALANRESREVGGLSSGSVRLPGIVAQSVGAMGVTGIVALLVPLVAVTAGSGGWLTWVLASVVIMAVAWGIARLASEFATTGGPYGLISKTLGRFWGVMAGWTYLGLIGLFSAGGLIGFAVYGSQVLQAMGIASGNAALDACYAAGLVGATLVAVSGMRRSAVVMLGLEALTVVVIMILMVGVLLHHRVPLVDTTQLHLHHSSLRLVVDGFVLAVLSFGGFETATVLGREAKNPLRAIPLAMLLTVVIAGVFWTFCAYTLFLGFQGSHADLATAAAPLKELATISGMGWMGNLLDATVTLTLFGSLIATFNGVSRLMFTMAREGLAPSPLTRVHRRWGTPWAANVAVAGAWFSAIAIIVGTKLAPLTAFGDFGDVSGYGFMAIYTVLAAAALVHLHRRRRLRPLDAVASTVAIAVMAYVFYENAFLPSPDGWIVYAVIGGFGAMVIAYVLIRVLRPSLLDRVGTSVDDDTPPDGPLPTAPRPPEPAFEPATG